MESAKSKLAVILLVSTLLATMLCVSCAKPESPPTGKPSATAPWDKIVLPLAVDLSGPYGQQNQLVINGLTDGLRYVNETGGVKGVPMQFVIKDTAGKVDNAVAIYNEFKNMQPKPALVSFLDTQVSVAMKDRFTEDKIINILGTSRGAALYPAGYSFALATDDRDLFAGFCDWLIEKEGAKHPKVAILTWDNVLGQTILEQVCLDYAKSKDIDIVTKELFNVTDVDVSAQLRRIKQAGAEWIYTNTLLIGPPRIANDAKANGMTDDFHFALSGVALNYVTMALGGGLEGWVGPSPWISWDESDIKGVQVADEQFKKNNRTQADRQDVYIGAFIGSLLIHQGLNETVAKFGWNGLTGSNLKEILENTKDFEAMGLTKISYSKELRDGQYYKMYKMTQGKIIPITDWRKASHLQ